MEADFREMLAHTVTLRRLAGTNIYGEPDYAAGVAHRARVSGRRRHVTDPNGRLVVSDQQVYLFGVPAPALTPLDAIVLPDGSQPPVLAVRSEADERGDYCQVVYLGGRQEGVG